jgi:hypothetical protein
MVKNNMKSILVTSVLNPVNAPLDYSSIRSVFSVDERIDQSINTIHSVRKFLGNDIHIVFVDCSNVLPSQISRIKNCLNSKDDFVDLSDNIDIRHAVESPNKGLGELKLIDWVLSNMDFGSDLYKISGRYFLDGSVDYLSFDLSKDFTCKARGFSHANNVCLTTFYRVRNKELFRSYVKHGYSLFSTYQNISAEHVLFNFLITTKNITVENLYKIGVAGKIAVTGDTHYN